MDGSPALAVYRFAIEDLYRQQEHVLDDKGEHLLSLSSRFSSAPYDAYSALSTADVKHPTVRSVERNRGHADLRTVPRDSGDQPQPAGPRRRVHRVPQAVRGQRQYVRVALQRRPAARLVPRPIARLPLDARLGAARQQHPDHRRREPDREDEGGHRAAAALSPAAQASARARHLSHLRHDDSARRSRREVSVRRRARMAAGVGGAARDRLPAAAARGPRAAGSTSTRTRASGAARTRRRSTACIRTCC